MRTIRITLKEGRTSTVLDSKGEKQIASLTLLPEKGKQTWRAGRGNGEMKLALIVTKLTGNEENDRMRAAEYCRYASHKDDSY